MTLDARLLASETGYLDTVADTLLAQAGMSSDLSGCLILVSSLPLAAELRSGLARRAGRPLLLPRFDTLRRWALSAPLAGIPVPAPDSERQVLLHAALGNYGGFDERSLWGLASELVALSDELSAAAVRLPEDEATLLAQLESAYRLRASAPLVYEARLVHEMWRVLAAGGGLDAPSVYRLRLARLADGAMMPLVLVLDGPADERLNPAEQEFVERYAARQPVLQLAPQRRGEGGLLSRTLAAVWPEGESVAPLIERAAVLRESAPQSPFAGRLQFVSTIGREAEAEAAAAQVGAWLAAGLRRIALVAEDRLTARRVRALLERRQVLVADETGWKLSTTRAAATLDALLETAAGDAYHQDVLDLFKSPQLFADVPPSQRAEAVLALEHAIRRSGARSGLDAFRHALATAGERGSCLVSPLLDRLEVALRVLNGKPVPLPKWIGRLLHALDALGAAESLRQDAAGEALLDLLDQRRSELAESTATHAFSTWRDWLDREFEAASFRDRDIASPVVMLPRHDARLRGFEAAIVIGADARQLAATAGGTFFNQAVRKELGLPTREEGERALRRDLELLLSVVPRVVVTWQREQDGEAQRLAPEFDLLATLNQLAWGDDLQAPPLPYRDSAEDGEAPVAATTFSAPTVPRERVPLRVSVSALGSLVTCPYRFFARHVLRLNELDEVAEEMEKQDYGLLVHRSLERFHAACPVVSELPPEIALASLAATVEEVFSAAERDNWLALGWRLRWQARLPSYLDWQRAREADGWRFRSAEITVARRLPLADGTEAELYGRIDRVDVRGAVLSLLDYKTNTRITLKPRLIDDVQLPAYALMCEGATEAAYVALDDEKVGELPCVGDLDEVAMAQGARLVQALDDMRAGAPLPAHGIDAACRTCEVVGLCRSPYVER